ncbi:MAG: S-layer homology domain-containing protein [Oscillatoriales cyanobacterium C42_A2020_001]|nr:S-layer homology domain-containing protein [Leptolyngbyaceae cyanobacterium C42_A2020_001]
MKAHYWMAGLGLTLCSFFSAVGVASAQTPSRNRLTQLDCLVGYPDGSFRSDRALTRYEFAAGMAACLDRQLQQFEADKGNFATKQEVETLLQTQQQLNQEVKQLNERVKLIPEE